MRAGQLRHYVELQGAAQTRDTSGGIVETWAVIENVWARVEPLTGNERLYAGQIAAGMTHKVTMRYTTNATTAKRVVWDGHTLNVYSVANIDTRGRMLELFCKENVAVVPLTTGEGTAARQVVYVSA